MPETDVISALTANHKCTVCGVSIPRHQVLAQLKSNDLVCHSVHCKNILAKKAQMSPAAFSNFLSFERKVLTDRAASQAAEKARVEDIEARQISENVDLLSEVLEKNTGLSETEVAVISIPAGRTEFASLSAERIENYENHLKRIVAEAQKYQSASEVPYDEGTEGVEREFEINARLAGHKGLSDFSDQLCTQCKGGCCSSGRDHGYLSVLVVRKFMDRHPELSDEEVIQTYLDLLHENTIQYSCINHSNRGCVLPREMRSGICNSFLCDGLNKYQKEVVQGKALGHALVIQRSSPYWERYKESSSNDVINVELINVEALHKSDDIT